MTEVVLWDYPKSSASYRVRIALNIAGIEHRLETVNLLGADHKSERHLARNPQGLVPVLDIDGHRLTQSLAILEYLDSTRQLNLLPCEDSLRAKVRAAAYSIAVDLHPICNLSVMRYATGGEEPERTRWMHHFIRPGLEALDALLAQMNEIEIRNNGNPSLLDICLIPQLYNARRWGVEYQDLNGISAIEKTFENHPAFVAAAPSE